MKIKITLATLCRCRHLPTAACRHLPRCRRCNRALSFGERAVCRVCMADAGRKESRHG